jgi:hypothetical protein
MTTLAGIGGCMMIGSTGTIGVTVMTIEAGGALMIGTVPTIVTIEESDTLIRTVGGTSERCHGGGWAIGSILAAAMSS